MSPWLRLDDGDIWWWWWRWKISDYFIDGWVQSRRRRLFSFYPISSCVSPYVPDCFRDISSICWWIFAMLLPSIHPGMNLIRFWGQKVKGQGQITAAWVSSTRRWRRVQLFSYSSNANFMLISVKVCGHWTGLSFFGCLYFQRPPPWNLASTRTALVALGDPFPGTKVIVVVVGL